MSIYIERSTRDTKALRLVTILVSIALIILSFIFFFHGIEKEDISPVISLAFTYIISIIVFGLYFKIKKPQHDGSSF